MNPTRPPYVPPMLNASDTREPENPTRAELEAALSAETQQRERFEEELWSAHKWLDNCGIPRADVGGEVFSLVGRMMRLILRA